MPGQRFHLYLLVDVTLVPARDFRGDFAIEYSRYVNTRAEKCRARHIDGARASRCRIVKIRPIRFLDNPLASVRVIVLGGTLHLLLSELWTENDNAFYFYIDPTVGTCQ